MMPWRRTRFRRFQLAEPPQKGRHSEVLQQILNRQRHALRNGERETGLAGNSNSDSRSTVVYDPWRTDAKLLLAAVVGINGRLPWLSIHYGTRPGNTFDLCTTLRKRCHRSRIRSCREPTNTNALLTRWSRAHNWSLPVLLTCLALTRACTLVSWRLDGSILLRNENNINNPVYDMMNLYWYALGHVGSSWRLTSQRSHHVVGVTHFKSQLHVEACEHFACRFPLVPHLHCCREERRALGNKHYRCSRTIDKLKS